MVEHRSAESKGLRSWVHRIFSLSHGCDKEKKHFSQNHLSHSILNFSVVRPLKLGTSNKKRVEKDVFRFLTSLGQRKSSESP